MTPNQQSDVIRRLRCTAGHLNAVIEMVEAGRPYEEVLHQLNAVQAALRVTKGKFLLCQAQRIQTIIRDSLSPQQRTSELKRLQFLYATFMQYSKSPF